MHRKLTNLKTMLHDIIIRLPGIPRCQSTITTAGPSQPKISVAIQALTLGEKVCAFHLLVCLIFGQHRLKYLQKSKLRKFIKIKKNKNDSYKNSTTTVKVITRKILIFIVLTDLNSLIILMNSNKF